MSANNLFIHDSPNMAKSFCTSLQYDGVDIEPIETAKKAIEVINSPRIRNLDCVIVHKDLGDYSGEGGGQVEKVVEKIHEKNPTTRIGVISGEYPNGRAHVLRLKADFYFDPVELALGQDGKRWVIKQVKKGPVLPDEISKRGESVATPPEISFSIENKR